MKRMNTKLPGYFLLLSILVIGAVGITITLTVLVLGITTQQTSLSYQHAAQARAIADTCAEEALIQIRDSTPFTGTENITLGLGSCEYTVSTIGGNSRLIRSTSTVATTIKKTQIIVSPVNPQMDIVSWLEVSDL